VLNSEFSEKVDFKNETGFQIRSVGGFPLDLILGVNGGKLERNENVSNLGRFLKFLGSYSR